MKKLSIVCSLIMAIGLIAAPAFATDYGMDYLEAGNTGGYGTCDLFPAAGCNVDNDCAGGATGPCNKGLKTWDTEITLLESDTVEIDIWIRGIRAGDNLVSGGFEIDPLSSSYEVVSITVYDGGAGGANYSSAPGLWDAGSTTVDIDGGGLVRVILGELTGIVIGDVNDDVNVAKLTVHCLAFGVDPMTVTPVAGFDTIVSGADGFVYDPGMLANAWTFNFNQTLCCDADSECEDGLYCNGVGTCGTDTSGLCGGSAGECIIGAIPCPPDDGECILCDDNGGAGACYVAADTACTGDGFCYVSQLSCLDDSDCPAGPFDTCVVSDTTCTDDICDGAGACTHPDSSAGTSCGSQADTDCTNQNTCDGSGGCDDNDETAGTSCDSDQNSCTDDECDGAGTCDHNNNMVACDDGEYCNGTDTCVGGGCNIHSGDPCDDTNDCTDDTCSMTSSGTHPIWDPSAGSCANVCNATQPTEACCDDAACEPEAVCQAGGVINIGDFWANCGDVGIKIDICLINLADTIGGFQMDLCEENDCLVCTDCELTERTTMFDCVTTELSNGCCRVILFSKNPGGLINPGECDIVTIVYELKDSPECCDTCIEINGESIILSDEFGYDILGVIGETGDVCPFNCGDIEPSASLTTDKCTMSDDDCTGNVDCPIVDGHCVWNPVPCTSNADCELPGLGWECVTDNTCNNQPHMDCGDGDVDIFDILLEVSFALGIERPDQCQEGARSNVPTGTPPGCVAPSKGTCGSGGIECDMDADCEGEGYPYRCIGRINILDIMVIIDMALDKQDCCSYYYAGIIY